MSNSYTLFAGWIPELTEKETAWLKFMSQETYFLDIEDLERWKNTWKGGVPDTGHWPGFCIDFIDKGARVRHEKTGDIDNVTVLVQEFLSKFRQDDIWSTTYACTCSSPLVGAFGGGVVVVSAQTMKWSHSWYTEARLRKEILED